ncbi:MAG: 50S ribosomal protein L4 [Nanoarchaeota archaeon]
MKVDVRDAENKKVGSVDLPGQFGESVRVDLIQRAALAAQNNKRQAYGAKEDAGMRHSADLSRRRRQYRGSYGFGISRVPRKILSRNGTRMYWVGAVSPGTVGGRRAHAPKPEKVWAQKINIKERRKAIRAALSATIDAAVVAKRGHKVPEGYPFVLDEAFESMAKTADVVKALEALGLSDELGRSSRKTIRAGRGKARGRKYKKAVGPLVIVSGKCDMAKAARNIPGVTVKSVDQLDADVLAPGCAPGRLALFTKKAIDKLAEAKLYS